MAQDVVGYKVVMIRNFKIINPAIILYFFDLFDPTVIDFLINQAL